MADLAVWQRTIVDEEGNVVPGAEIEVRREEDDSLATLYADRAGETPLANPMAADMSGFVRFFAQGDAYTITAVGAGSTRTWRFDPTGRLQEFDRISEALVADDAADLVAARSNLGTFSTVADVQNSHIPPVLDSIRTNGYYDPGDGGEALYKRVASEPSHAGKIQSADGAWWEIAEPFIDIFMFGAVEGSDISSALTSAAEYGAKRVNIPAGTFRLSNAVALTDIDLDIVGAGSASTIIEVDAAITALSYVATDRKRLFRLFGVTFRSTSATAELALDVSFPLTSDIDQRQVVLDDVKTDVSASGEWTAGCIRLTNATNPFISNCVIRGSGIDDTPYGISFEGQCLGGEVISTRVYLVGNAIQIGGTSEGLYLSDYTAVTVDKGLYASTTGYEPWIGASNFHINARIVGIDLTNRGQSTFVNGLLYANDSVSTPGWVGISIAGGNNTTISNVIFNDAEYEGTTIGVSISDSFAIRIQNNVFLNLDTAIAIDANSTYIYPLWNEYRQCATNITVDGTEVADILSTSADTLGAAGVEVKGGAGPVLTAKGAATDISMNIASKGSGAISLLSGNGLAFRAFAGEGAVNYLRARADSAGLAPRLIAEGDDTDIDLILQGKGKGVIKVASSAWDNSHFSIGGYHLWVDGSSKLRIKLGAPASDTDGVVVGTQT